MTKAQVTLRLTPNELQIVDEALRMYSYTNHHIKDIQNPLDGYIYNFSITDNDNCKAVRQANAIRNQIGLK